MLEFEENVKLHLTLPPEVDKLEPVQKLQTPEGIIQEKLETDDKAVDFRLP